uniref:Methyltransferase domain-containing protein n=1 Tax=Guillardia theta TaxID=55529 RepID=A0A7S4UTB9_GUITH
MNMAADYGSQKFWDERYAKASGSSQVSHFEWFPSKGQDVMIEAIKRTGVGSSDRILDVGCGSSRLIWDLCDEGYTRVIGIDFSPVVIKKLQAEREQCAGAKEQTLHLFHMDAAALAFSDASIALVVDKGLLDSVLAVHDRRELWKRSGKKEAQDPFLKRAAREAEEKGRKVLVELRRILKSDGVYLVVSYEEPTYRMPFLRQASAEGEQLWREVSCETYDEDNRWFLYTCKA